MLEEKRFAVSYTRFSHRKQSSGSTLERQQATLNAYLSAHPELTLFDQFTDLGVSSYRGKHAAEGDLARFIDALDEGKLPTPLTLIVESIDRLSREPIMDAFDRFSAILRKGVTLVVCDLNLEVDRERLSREPYLLYGVIGAMTRAHEESKRKSDLVTAAWASRIKVAQAHGLSVKGYVGPAWVKRDPTTNMYVEIEECADVVRMMFEWRIAGLSANAIAKRLNETKVPVFRAHTKPGQVRQGWYQAYITEILKNRQVLGEHAFKTLPPIPGYFPQIITQETFYQAQTVGKRVVVKAGRKGLTFSNLFTGIAHCAHCGGHMQMNRNRAETEDGPKPIKYLECSNQKRRHECKATGMINYPNLEEAVLKRLPEIPWNQIIKAEAPENPVPSIDKAISAVRLEIDTQTKRRDRASELILESDGYREEFAPKLDEARFKLATAKENLKKFEAERAIALRDWESRPDMVRDAIAFHATIASASETEQYILRSRLSGMLASMITEMKCDTVGKTVSITYGDRWELHIAMPIRRRPLISHRWLVDLASLAQPSRQFLDEFDRAIATTAHPEMIIKQVRPA